MLRNQHFFRSFWPGIAPAVTWRASDPAQDVKSLLRLLRLRPGARILDVPCGFGRHAVELARRGFDTTGVDISPQLLAQARAAAAAADVNLKLRQGDMRRLSKLRSFDLVLNLFTSFGYFGDAGDFAVLRGFRRALRPGGRLLMQVVNRDSVLCRHAPPSTTRMSKGVIVENRSFDLATSILTMEWTARRSRRRTRGRTFLRIYSAHELVRMLKQAGFLSVSVFGDLNGRPLSLDSHWQVLLARR